MPDPKPSDDDGPDREPGDAPASRQLGATVWRWLKRLMVLVALGLVAGAVGLGLMLRSYEADLPSTAELRDYHPPQVTRVMARDGSLLAELFVQRRTVVSIHDIPKVMKVSVLAAEDADFYRHEGLDYVGMLRALVVNLRHGKMRQGGSTITQQVVKNVLLSPDRTFARKAREVLLARRIEQQLSKDEILELYLNHIYFGHGRYGIEEAARYYFGKGISDVSLAEAAMLAGLPKGPSIYSPRVDPQRAVKRRDAVLDQLGAKGFATASQIEAAKKEPIVLAPAVEAMPELAPEVVDEVRRKLRDLVGPAASRGGYTVHTTIDPQLQSAARKAVRENLDDYAKRHGLLAPLKKSTSKSKQPVPFQGTPKIKGHHVYRAVVTGADDDNDLLLVRVGTVDGVVRLSTAQRYNPKALPASQFAEKGALVRVSAVAERGVGDDGVPREFHLELAPQSALVAIDTATREVRALVGSYEALRGTLDRATFAHRQPGSAFKPFVYSYAIHSRRLTAASVVEPTATEAPDEANHSETKEGDKPPLRMRDAIAHSVNRAAIWTLNEVGPEAVVSWAKAMGIESELKPTESLALGAYEVTPRELATAYATLASGGVYEAPVLISRVVGPDGVDVELPTAPPKRRVMEADEAYVVTSLLTSVVRSGTGARARKLGLPLAGKTGTSNEAKDAWFAGYSPELVCVTWTGYDDATPLGRRESGASAALPAWMGVMKAAHAKNKPKPFSKPAAVVTVTIDPRTGLLPFEGQEETVDEVFLAGTEPTVMAEPPDTGAGGADGAGGAPALAGDEPDGAGGAAGEVMPVELPPTAKRAEITPPPASDAPPPF